VQQIRNEVTFTFTTNLYWPDTASTYYAWGDRFYERPSTDEWKNAIREYQYQLVARQRELALIRIPVRTKVRLETVNRQPPKLAWCARMQAFRCRNRSTKGGKLPPQPGLR
jgi:hypothetical protein